MLPHSSLQRLLQLCNFRFQPSPRQLRQLPGIFMAGNDLRRYERRAACTARNSRALPPIQVLISMPTAINRSPIGCEDNSKFGNQARTFEKDGSF